MEFNLSQRHIMALNALLAVALVYFGALSVNDVLALRRTPSDAPVLRPSSRVGDAPDDRSRTAYQAIVERDIFNIVPPAPSGPPPVEIEDLHLKLIGISQMSNGKPYAIIEDRSGQQSVYRVGEMIPDAGKLVSASKERAIVEHGGKRVAIDLPKIETAGTTGFPGMPGMPMLGMRRLRLPEEPASASDESDDTQDNAGPPAEEANPGVPVHPGTRPFRLRRRRKPAPGDSG